MSSIANVGRIVPLHKGNYSAVVQYVPLDEVLYNGSSYRVKFGVLPPLATLPTNDAFWTKVATAGPGVSGIAALANGADAYAVDLTFTLQDGTTYTVTTPNLQGPAGTTNTPAEILSKLLTVDGLGSGLDADTLQGYSADFFTAAIDDSRLPDRLKTTGEPIANANLAIADGWYYSSGSLSNWPSAGSMSLRVDNATAAKIQQTCVDLNVVIGSATNTWKRKSADTGATWSAWVAVRDTVTELDATYARLGVATTFTNSLGAATVSGAWVASQAEAEAGVSTTKVMNPLRVMQAINYTFTASGVLSKLLTVDGAASGLDADLLDGQHGSYYQNASNQNAGTLPDARLPAQLGTSTGVSSDADTIVLTGFYKLASPSANVPVAEAGTILHIEYNVGTYTTQQWHGVSSNKMYTRYKTGGVWQPWIQMVYSQADQDARYAKLAGTLTIAAGTLGAALDDQLVLSNVTGLSSNIDGIRTILNRNAAGSSWTSSDVLIQRYVDASLFGYIRFVGTAKAVAFGYGTTDRAWMDSTGNFTVSASMSAATIAGTWVALQAEAEAGASSTKVMTPLRTLQAINANYTAANVLVKLMTVDGTGSGLDADLLDGLHGSDFVRSNANQSLAAGFYATAVNDGTNTTGTYLPTYVGGNLRRVIFNGAGTLTAPTVANDYTLVILVTNGASVGATTITGFNKIGGSSLTTTNAHKFFLYITKINGITSLNIEALQ